MISSPSKSPLQGSIEREGDIAREVNRLFSVCESLHRKTMTESETCSEDPSPNHREEFTVEK